MINQLFVSEFLRDVKYVNRQEDAGIDLPSGNVRGWHHGAGGGGTPLILGPAKVGQSSIIRTPGSH